ncbi:MAG: hypothetical protein GF353_27255 [Candidatus Lokiarchaeota archaeon]|nr:hypothetical protein [Candidatus Lokiarchaeota archaeon]
MNSSESFKEKLLILKHETSIIKDKINNITGNLWKLRQINLTLWLAAIGFGSGAITSNNQPNIMVLSLSILIPIWFFITDTRYNVWYRRFRLREIQIEHFFSLKEYVLPANKIKMSFDECLENENMNFPIFDMSGTHTFGNNGDFKWKKSLLKSYCDPIPLFFYGTQIFASILFSSIELSKKNATFKWWIFPLTSLVIMISIYIYAQIRKKRWKRNDG